MISCGSSLAAFLGLCLPATFSWTPLGSQDQLTSCIRGSCRASLWPGSLSKPVSHLQHPAPRGDKPSFRALQQVPGPGATIPADGIKDSSFLCWIQLQGLLSHSSSPHSPISQQLWSRYSCKKSNLCIAFFFAALLCPMSHMPSFPPSSRDWVLFLLTFGHSAIISPEKCIEKLITDLQVQVLMSELSLLYIHMCNICICSALNSWEIKSSFFVIYL